MAIAGFDSLDQVLEKITGAARRAVQEYRAQTDKYDGMLAQAKASFDESRLFWQEKTLRQTAGNSRAAGVYIEAIDRKITDINAYIAELTTLDKAFRRFRSSYVPQVRPVRENLSGNVDFNAKASQIASQVSRLCNECKTMIRAWLIEELEVVLAGKRKRKYTEILEMQSDAERIADVACEKLPQSVRDFRAASHAERDREIDRAASETADLIVQIGEARAASISSVAGRLGAQLDGLLTANDIQLVYEMDALLQPESGGPPESPREYISLGRFAADISECSRFSELWSVTQRRYQQVLGGGRLTLPAIYDARRAAGFLIRSSPGNARQAKDAALSMMFAQLNNVPATRQVFVLFDPEERSKGFDPYLDFARLHPELTGGRIHATQSQMQEELEKLSAYIDGAGQTKMVGYSNIFEYNAAVPDKQEPMRTLVVMDYPKYFDERMLDNLYNIIKNGACFGVGVILQHNADTVTARASENYTALLRKIEKETTILSAASGRLRLDNGVYFEPKATPDANAIIAFEEAFARQLESIRASGLPLRKILAAAGGGESSAKMLSIPIGIDENGNVQFLRFGDAVGNGVSHYALVTGSLGSGKSTLLHTVIMSAVSKYSPEDLVIYMMDFKEGAEFKLYADRPVPHIRLLALAAMQEFGYSILNELCVEMERRAALFKEALAETKQDIRNITQYRNVTGKPLPRILVIADEFQNLVDADANRKVANECAAAIARLVSMARVFGIHFVFATQTLSRIYSGGNFAIQKATLNEMHVRIGLRGTQDEADKLFGDKGKAAYLKYIGEERGLGAYVEDDVSGSPIGFRVAHCPQQEQLELLDSIRAKYPGSCCETRVFSRDHVPKLADCAGYREPEPEEFLSSVTICLGEPIMTGVSIRMDINRKRRNNLLIVGSNQAVTDQLVNLYLLNAVKASSHLSEHAAQKSVYYLDGARILGEEYAQTTWATLRKCAENIELVETNGEAVEAIDRLYSIYEARRRAKGGRYNTIHLVIKNIQWVELLFHMLQGRNLDDFLDQSPSGGQEGAAGGPAMRHPNDVTLQLDDLIDSFGPPAGVSTSAHGASSRGKLETLAEAGYLAGINIVISSFDLLSISEYMNTFFKRFPNRVVYALSNTDADKLIPEARVEALPANIAVFTDGVNRTYQFKPFSYEELL